MRKWIALFSLTVFLALQYGKLVSYWHCKVSAAITQAICDCEKLLIDIHKDDNNHATPVAIAKEKAEESYLFYEQAFHHPPIVEISIDKLPTYNALLPDGFHPPVFQPPRI